MSTATLLDHLTAAQAAVAGLHADECDPALRELRGTLRAIETHVVNHTRPETVPMVVNERATLLVLAQAARDAVWDADGVLVATSPDATDQELLQKLWALERINARAGELVSEVVERLERDPEVLR